MPLAKVTDEDYEKLDDILKKEYHKKDGDEKWTLKVEPVDGFDLQDVSGLKTTLSTTRAELKTAQKELKKFDGLDLDEVNKALKVMEDLDGMSLDDKTKAAFDSQKQQLLEKHNRDMDAVKESRRKMVSQLEEVLADNTLMQHIKDIEGDELALPKLLRDRVKVEERDGKMVVLVLDKNGNEAIGDSSGSPMTVKQLVEETSKDPVYARYFGGSGASGTGATSTKGKTGTTSSGKKTILASDMDAINANLDKIASGEVVVVDDE